MFINRIAELALLEELYASEKAECLVLYGRRRVGKTELLTRFCENKNSIFYVCDFGSEISLRTTFSAIINQSLPNNDKIHAIYNGWEELFQALGNAAKEKRLVVVIDDFHNLVTTHPEIISLLQRMWVKVLKETNILLILSGSDIKTMKDAVLFPLTHSSEMHAHQLLLESLSFKDARSFFTKYDDQDQIRSYAVYGGMPAYLRTIDPEVSLPVNLSQTILERGSFLYDEARNILQQEIREPRSYFAILQAIADGKTRLNEIKQATGMEGAHVYLDALQQLNIIERIVPLTDPEPQRSRRGQYRFRDHFLRFWFRFVLPNHTALERGLSQQVLDHQIMPVIDDYSAPAFVEICQQFFQKLGFSGRLSFHPQNIGKWWNNQEEIDLVVLGDGIVELVDCNWHTQPVGTGHLAELERKAELIRPDLPGFEIRYGLCSRSGFTRQLVDNAHQRQDVSLYPLNQILKM